MPVRKLAPSSSSPMRAAAQPVIARTTVAGRASLETPSTNSTPSTPTQTTTALPTPAPPIEVLIASLSPLPSSSSTTSPSASSANPSAAVSPISGDHATSPANGDLSAAFNSNPTLNPTHAQQLVDALFTGPVVIEPSRLLAPIKALCAPSQSPAIRASGYSIIKWYCESQMATGTGHLGAMERKHIWDALCAAGSAWHAESYAPRLDALEAFIAIDSDAEGEQSVLEELKSWMADAVDQILGSSPPLSANPNVLSNANSNPFLTAEVIVQERDAAVERMDRILANLVFKSSSTSSSASNSAPTPASTPLSDHEVSSIIDLYSSWTNRAVREEYRHPSSVISISSMTVTAATITPRPQASHNSHSPFTPHGRKVSSTSAFSFPSSIEERERWGSKSAHVILGGMFLDLIERCLKEHVLIPNLVLPQVLNTLCYTLALTMKPIPPGFVTSGFKSTISTPALTHNHSHTHIHTHSHSHAHAHGHSHSLGLGGTPIFQSQSNSSSSSHLPMTNGNSGNNPSMEAIQVPSTPKMQEDKPLLEIDERAAKLTQELLTNSLYTASSIQYIKNLLLPSASNSQSHFVASGAMRAVRLAVITSLQSELARQQLNDVVSNHFNPSGLPVLFGDTQMFEMGWKGTSGGKDLRFEKIGGGVKEAVVQWRLTGNQEGKEGVLMECCGLVHDVLTLSPKGAVSEVSRFAGELIQELAEIIKEHRTPDGSIYRLRLGAPSSAPTPLLNSICDLLRLPLANNVTKPTLSTILLSLSDHLNDSDALGVINHLQTSGQLSPFYPDWAKNFRLLINAFYGNARAYPRSRRIIAKELSKVYSDITDIDHEDLRKEIVEDMVAMWERTLHEETNEEILHAAYEATSKEIVLSTMTDDNLVNPIAERIQALWMKVAITAPPYWENDRLIMTNIIPGYYYTPSVVSTPNPEVAGYRSLHSPNPSLPLNSQTSSGVTSPPSLFPSEPPTPSMDSSYPSNSAQYTGQASQSPNPQGSPSSQRHGRAVLAVIFLIKAFNNLAFRSPQSLKILLTDAARHQSASAATMAISLFRGIVQLFGIAKDRIRRVDDPTYVNGGDENECFDRVQCPKARLVIVQWLLRLRADREHRIYAVGDIENEVTPLASLIYRTESSKIDALHQPQADRASRDLPTGIAERRRQRAETKGANDLRTHRTMERDKEREQASRDQTREPRGRGTPDALGNSTSRSRSRPPASPQTPLRYIRPVESLWSLPDPLVIELEKHTTRPSPAMATFRSFKEEQGHYWLHVDYYVKTLADILENGRDWEIVSYILCHLPLQLANKHFFCGPKTKIQIRRLVLVVCSAINDDRLCGNMDVLLPNDVVPVDVQALLYHTLTVLISYHKSFDPVVGEYDQQAKSVKSDIVEVIYRGLAKDEATNKPCLEALTLAVYELPEQIAKFTGPIIEKLSRIMSNPNMAVHILELLVIIGYTPKLYSGSFREEEYRRVFGVALLYIEHHYRPDASTLRTSDGRDSYSLAQHVLNTAFFVIYIWFLAIKIEDRPRYVSFITKQLLIANNRKEVIEPTTEVCFDWLARYAYSNADPKSAPSFLYRSIVAPGSPEYNVTRSWDDQHAIEMENTAGVKVWKLGNSIVTISTTKKPPGWVRIVSRRPSGLTELLCRLENWPHVSPGDYAPDLVSMPATMLADRPMFDEDGDDSLDIEEELLDRLVNDIFEQSDVIQDLKKPDPISGYVWSGVAPSQRRKDVTVDPAYIALLLSAYPSGMMTRPSRFSDYNIIKDVLKLIDYTPVIDTHKVGVLYVAPGQTTEAEILANQHGSPAYTRFLAELGRVIKPSNQLEVYTGGLRRETHGEYAYAWWDDMSQIIYHVGTIMPNISNCLYKKQEIGNDGVKIIWNDGGTPFKFDTILSQYTLINVVVEPHSIGARGAYSDNLHENEYFKVTLQTASNLPRITPIGEFKIVSAEKLSSVLRHFTLLASLFCKAWEMTGMDGEGRYPFQTNWQARLRYITKSEDKLPPKPQDEDPDQRSSGLVYREAARDFTRAY